MSLDLTATDGYEHVRLEWKGPYSLRKSEECRLFDPPHEAGVYLWAIGGREARAVWYVGETGDLRRRLYDHVVTMLGGGYLLYHPDELTSGRVVGADYSPTYEEYFTKFVGDWNRMSELAYRNLIALEFFWARYDGKRAERQAVESALIYEAVKGEVLKQRVSRSSSICRPIRITHKLADGVSIRGLAETTSYGNLRVEEGRLPEPLFSETQEIDGRQLHGPASDTI